MLESEFVHGLFVGVGACIGAIVGVLVSYNHQRKRLVARECALMAAVEDVVKKTSPTGTHILVLDDGHYEIRLWWGSIGLLIKQGHYMKPLSQPEVTFHIKGAVNSPTPEELRQLLEIQIRLRQAQASARAAAHNQGVTS